MAFKYCLLAKSHGQSSFSISRPSRLGPIIEHFHLRDQHTKKCLHRKEFNSHRILFCTPIWPPFHCFWNTNMVAVTSIMWKCSTRNMTKPKLVLTWLICVFFRWTLVLCFCFGILLHTFLCYLLWLRRWLFTEVIKRSLRYIVRQRTCSQSSLYFVKLQCLSRWMTWLLSTISRFFFPS